MKKNTFKSRKDPRIQTIVTATFKSNDPDEHAKEGVITNFSRTGLYIETVFVYPVNTPILIDVFLPDESTPLRLTGDIRNVILDEHVIGGMGVKIDNSKISEPDKNRLQEFFDLNHIYGWFC